MNHPREEVLMARAIPPRSRVRRKLQARFCRPAGEVTLRAEFNESHCNIQRRLYDYQFSLTQTPLEFEEAHQHFLELYNTTAHQGLLKEQFASPMPLHVLGEAKGRLYTPQELERKFARALFPRITNRYGCVTLHSYHFYVDQGLPQKQVLLWVYGQELRAVCEQALLAEYHCHYDLREGKVTDIRVSQFSPSPFASRQEQG